MLLKIHLYECGMYGRGRFLAMLMPFHSTLPLTAEARRRRRRTGKDGDPNFFMATMASLSGEGEEEILVHVVAMTMMMRHPSVQTHFLYPADTYMPGGGGGEKKKKRKFPLHSSGHLRICWV